VFQQVKRFTCLLQRVSVKDSDIEHCAQPVLIPAARNAANGHRRAPCVDLRNYMQARDAAEEAIEVAELILPRYSGAHSV